MNNIGDLLKLIKENPDLELAIISKNLHNPLFIGEWGVPRVDYVCHEDGETYIRSIDEEKMIDKQIDLLVYLRDSRPKEEDCVAWLILEEQAREYVDSLDWKKSIVIHVDSIANAKAYSEKYTDEERFDLLWERLRSASNIDYLDYGAAVTIGSVFGEMRGKIHELMCKNNELFDALVEIMDENTWETVDEVRNLAKTAVDKYKK